MHSGIVATFRKVAASNERVRIDRSGQVRRERRIHVTDHTVPVVYPK